MLKEKIAESRSKRGLTPQVKGPADVAAFLIATAGGAGMIPWGPGTWGSLVGLAIVYALIVAIPSDPLTLQNWLIIASVVTCGTGIWAGNRAERIFGRKDPGQVVIDEVCGQIITFVFFAPYLTHLQKFGARWEWWLIPGFLLFRAADIFKPYPINKLQDLEGGFGVMMDDVLAGIYAAVALSLVLQLGI